MNDLFWKEEREFMKEAVRLAQEGQKNKFEEMRIKLEQLKVQRDAERQELAKQKLLQKEL